MTTNIGYWERILQSPTSPYQELFESEKKYLTTHISKDSSVLDVGCGDGTTIKSILPIATNVVGIDNDPKAVADAQLKLKSTPSVKILLADALELPFPDQTFDVVTHMMTLVNFKEDKVRALIEMARVLKDDGQIIVSVYSENALSSRLEMYKQINVPIERIDGTRIVFDKSVGANESEQFSKEQFELLATNASLEISDCQKVGTLGYIFKLTTG
ncbi:MAG: class I SAM-dependent methyltransferase [Candidatus Andersenbacteria bacterium]